MTAHSEIVVDEFCERCQWAYESWSTRRVLFDDKTRSAKLQTSKSGKALYRISEIMQDYWILQVSKLHDPASQQGQINLGIDSHRSHGGERLRQSE
jgi:hypothetical protein